MNLISKFIGILLATFATSVSIINWQVMANTTQDNQISWSHKELALIDSLALKKQPQPINDATNKFANNPFSIALGKAIFNDVRFSANQAVSCASCHQENYNFTDNLPVAKGVGVTSRRSMPLNNIAQQKWFFWDGRADSLWSQALGPIENPLEHGITRVKVYQLIAQHYQTQYQEIFGTLPEITITQEILIATPNTQDTLALNTWHVLDNNTQQVITQTFVNVGKAIAAFVSTIKHEPTAFDNYAWALNSINKDDATNDSQMKKEARLGLKLFIGKAKCINCHNGSNLSNGEFHNVGITDGNTGRASVLSGLKSAEFSCLSQWSDIDSPDKCLHLRFLDLEEKKYQGSFKTPSLRNVAIRPPYMHAGQFKTLYEVIENYQQVSALQSLASDEILHEQLTDEEIEQLIAFLHTLTTNAENNSFIN